MKDEDFILSSFKLISKLSLYLGLKLVLLVILSSVIGLVDVFCKNLDSCVENSAQGGSQSEAFLLRF